MVSALSPPFLTTKAVALNVSLSTNVLETVIANVTILASVIRVTGEMIVLVRSALSQMAKNVVVSVNVNATELANVNFQEKEKLVNVSNAKVTLSALDTVHVTVMEAVLVSPDMPMVFLREKSVIALLLVQATARTMVPVSVVFATVMLNTNFSLIALAKNVQFLVLLTKTALVRVFVVVNLVGSGPIVPKKLLATKQHVSIVSLIQTVVGVTVPTNVKTSLKLVNALTKTQNATRVVSFCSSMLPNARLVVTLWLLMSCPTTELEFLSEPSLVQSW
jgi:hypothetical protein